MEGDVRKTGIAAVGDCRWGTHFCLFYRTQEDLIDILVPYFKAGLENNEFCLWVTSKPLQVEEARSALAQAVEGLEDYLRRGQVEILDYTQWYLQSGKFEADHVLQGWVEKERQAIGRGWDGLRLTGNTFWLEKKDWRAFADYEAAVNAVIGRHRMVALCTYSLDRCGTAEILDVVATHQFALIEQEGQWRIIESGERRRAEKEISRRNRELSVLYQISQATVQSLDLQETLHQALGATLEALEVEVGAIYLMEPDGETMTLRASQGHTEAFVRAVQCLKRGVGIPPELLPKVFDLFVQADRSLDRAQGGLGVGLTLVRNLVEMHGGSVEAYSAGPGQGSEFIVRLPALPGVSRSKVPGRQPVASEEISGRPRRILVVDDNLDAAKMLALCLEMWGHQVQVTHDGLTAIETAMAYRPEVVLLDLGLPGMDGYEVARRLRQQAGLSGARLVALTGYGHEEARRRSLETGFDRHLVKPVGVAELQRLLVTLPEGL